MKKLALLLALVLLLSVFWRRGKKSLQLWRRWTVVDDEPADDTPEKPSEPMGELIIGNTTGLSGTGHHIGKAMHLIKLYGTLYLGWERRYDLWRGVFIKWNSSRRFGNYRKMRWYKTYVWTIKDGLVYNDGTPL